MTRRLADPPGLAQPLRTRRLTLRTATADDAQATFEYRRLEPVSRWLLELPPDLRTYEAAFTDPARLATTVVIELGDRTIGDFRLRVNDAWSQAEVADEARGAEAELGGVIHPACTGHGYATEATAELLRYCFEDLGVRRVVARSFAANDAVVQLMERVGMRREAYMVRDALHRSGQWLDSVRYAILRDEWPATAEKLWQVSADAHCSS
jgi:RimJ/RimL family protein N-acetyltransferase